jgi:MFS family permease
MSASAATATHDRRLVGWLSLGQLITWGSVFYGFALLMEPVERELGIGRAQSSLAFSLALLAEGLLAFPVGRLIDRGHERAVMTGGSVLVAVALLLHSAIGSLAAFYAVWTLLGVGMAATLYAPVFAVVTRRYPQDFRRAIITMTFLGGLASTVFIPLTSWLIHALGWRHALWVLAAIQVVVCVPLHAHWLKHAPRRVQPPGEQASAAQQRSLGHHLRSTPVPDDWRVCGADDAAVTSALPAHMISLLRESGLGEAWVIVIPASIGAIQVAGRLLLLFL